jgi:hypothetical protein
MVKNKGSVLLYWKSSPEPTWKIPLRCNFPDRGQSLAPRHLETPLRPPIASFQSHHSDAMEGDYNLQDIFSFWDSQGSSPLRGTVTSSTGNALSLPSSVVSSAALNDTPRALSQHSHPRKLTFIQEADWDPEKTYSQDPPTHLHYSIEWRVTQNGRAFLRGTEPDVVLAPSCYWQRYLKAQAEDLVIMQTWSGSLWRAATLLVRRIMPHLSGWEGTYRRAIVTVGVETLGFCRFAALL